MAVSHILFLQDVLLCVTIHVATEIVLRWWRSGSRSDGEPSPARTVGPTVSKSRLPVVEFARFVERRNATCCVDGSTSCAVCMDGLGARDEMRELGNCSHVFHKTCIDRWLDYGHDTCPLCRRQLLPPLEEVAKTLEDRYIV